MYTYGAREGRTYDPVGAGLRFSEILGPSGVNGFNRTEVIRPRGRFIRNRVSALRGIKFQLLYTTYEYIIHTHIRAYMRALHTIETRASRSDAVDIIVNFKCCRRVPQRVGFIDDLIFGTWPAISLSAGARLIEFRERARARAHTRYSRDKRR